MIRNLVEGYLSGGTDINVSRSGNTLTIAFTGTGAGSSRTDAQVEELARDAVGTALQANVSTGPRVGITRQDAANTITLALLGLATVAGTGSYNDLSDQPTIPAEYDADDMRSDFAGSFRSSTSGPRIAIAHDVPGALLTLTLVGLATVAGTGSYNDLTNRPTIPAAPAGFALASSPTGRIPEANAASESVIGGSISGQVITLTRRDGMNPITITIPSGGSAPPVSTHQRYGAYGSDSTFVATDFTGAGGVGSTNNSLTLAGATVRSYVAFWSAMALTTINPDGRLAFGGNNLFSRFTGSRLTIGADNGYLYVSNSTFPTGVINGAWTLS